MLIGLLPGMIFDKKRTSCSAGFVSMVLLQNKTDLKNAEFYPTGQSQAKKTVSSEKFVKKIQLKEKAFSETLQ